MKKNNLIKAYFLISSITSTFMGVLLKLWNAEGYNFALIIGILHFIGFIYFLVKKPALTKQTM
jgi:hypothetical protein